MKGFVPSLNGFRCLSIMMVIGYHLQYTGYLGDNKVLHYISLLFFNGPLGVNIFFIISGFLITTLLIEEEKNFGNISFRNFYIRRVFRVFPAYYFLLLVYAILQYLGYLHIEKAGWLSVVTFTKQFYNSQVYQIGHLWTLSVEEIFYLIWPLVFSKFRKNTIFLIIAGICFFVILRIAFYDFQRLPLANTIFSTGDSLLVGCLLAIKYPEISSFVKTKKVYIYPVVGALFAFSLLYKYLYNSSFSQAPSHFMLQVQAVVYGLFGDIGLFTNVLLGFIIIYSINIKNSWFKFLNSAVVDHLGKLSYSIYLWQQIFTSNRGIMYHIPFVSLVVMIYLAASFSYYFVENPFLKVKQRFMRTPELLMKEGRVNVPPDTPVL